MARTRHLFVAISCGLLALIGVGAWVNLHVLWALVVVGPLVLLGLRDMLQREHIILRNFPIIGHGRYLLESVRPEIQQYFIEMDTEGRPFSREERSVVYQRAKRELDTLPFGTRYDITAAGYTWLEHSLAPQPPPEPWPRIVVGAPRCEQPYSASPLNISAMSFGALSSHAVRALNGAARDEAFAQNTGEGGISEHHLDPGGDLIWQIGTGYFGCRTEDGKFDPDRFTDTAQADAVKMIEIKLSQGAKPGHGGILPGRKVSAEIARVRGIPEGKDVVSPPWHTAFGTPIELVQFVADLRARSGGKPVGVKLCVGRRRDVFALIKAMRETGEGPDFIAVDGAEGGTGAAPLEFSNHVGWPLLDALTFVHDALTAAAVRDRVKLIASGRVIDGFDMALRFGLGANLCYSARGMMFALGCIQALRCNNNTCPTGITTQDPRLVRGLHIDSRRERVANYHRNTMRHFVELMAAGGCQRPEELDRSRFQRRTGPNEIQDLARLFPPVPQGVLLEGRPPADWAAEWQQARADAF